ncbi:transmembrane protein 230 [Anthonomus grandis grandis]|uniref:transmembrane protein 230 n=1 Tax=Anthonomus grandis grandis TaxID=2921223 RepID=UPI002165BF54|nr:transmembrane protein 230 [Anthonomus grandis grandis]
MSSDSISEFFAEISRRRAKQQEYCNLPSSDCGFVGAQFQVPAQKIPWKAIVLATMLLVGGTTLLVFGSLAIGGRIELEYPNRMWPMIILGIIMFIPGAYHVRIAYYAYKEVPGFSFDDIPEFD